MEKLNVIKEKVYEATGVPKGSIVYGRPVMLHDVLRAMEGYRNDVWLSGDGFYVGQWTKPDARWNLALPLDEQEPEVIEFLYNILCV